MMTTSTAFSECSIIYVEDEIIVAIEIAEQLQELGFKDVRIAHTLREAEAQILESQPDVALLDVNLGNGERTTDLGLQLRESGTQVIFASGYNKSELSERLQSFDFLEKPLGREDVSGALMNALSKRGKN